MRTAALLLAALAVPLPLLAQYPEPGSYTAGATPAGSTQLIPLKLTVEKKGDSTIVHLLQPDDKGDNELPLIDQRAYKSGFEIVLGVVDGGLACRFAPPNKDGRWEANCEDPDHSALYQFFFKKAS
ncbi:MAG: hypothetical protein ABIZ70_11555 [Gemmatimonadales bacterium]